MASDWDESRIDIIGQNGNDGLHYNKDNKMDEIDAANLQVELNEQRSIKYAQQQAQTLEVQPVGHCLYCHEKFLTDSRMIWCDEFCRDSWQKYQALKKVR